MNTGAGGVHTFTVTINGATQLFLRLPVTEQGFSGCAESAPRHQAPSGNRS